MDSPATSSPQTSRVRRRRMPGEFFASVLLLLATVVVVQAAYVVHVLPQAAAAAAAQRLALQIDPTHVPDRSVYVLIRDYEAEAEIILTIWALLLLGLKTRTQQRERRALQAAILEFPQDAAIAPEDTRAYARQIESLPSEARRLLAPRALLAALARFGATCNVQEAATAGHAVCQSEAEQLDAEMSMLRYIAWAIPAIGFIGAVRGIGDSLLQAHAATDGDVSSVTQSLGLAFNSTLLALLLSIVLMLALHQLQRLQERLVLDAETYLDQRIIRNMQAPPGSA
jgi:biopolymer transport protein ExbB/TolQ